jgi:uncharacterized protein
MAEDVLVRDNTSQRRYELFVDGEAAGLLLYRQRPSAVALIHTEVDPRYEGHGLGGRLVERALTDIRDSGMRVVPICPFVSSYIEHHPEYRDLVADAGEAPE